ncbi:MAG: PQQ-binding-like beta-propeller repeat protein [Halobacteriota archaeon]
MRRATATALIVLVALLLCVPAVAAASVPAGVRPRPQEPSNETGTESTATRTSGWTMPGGGPGRTGYNPVSAAPETNVTRLWTVERSSSRSPAVSGDAVIGVVYGRLKAFNSRTGAGQWTAARTPGYPMGVSVADGTVVVPTNDLERGNGFVLGVDEGNGTIRYNRSLVGPLEGSAAIADGTAYVAARAGRAYALDLRTGEVQWNVSVGEGVTPPAVANGTVYLGGDGLVALDAVTGETQWSKAVTPDTTPAITDGTVYVVDGDSLRAYDASTGDQQWTAPIPREEDVFSPTIVGDTVYVATSERFDGGTIAAFDATTGDEQWRETVPLGVAASPAAAGDLLYVGTNGGNVTAVERANGSSVWELSVADGNYQTHLAVGNGIVYAGSMEGFSALGEAGGDDGANVTLAVSERFPEEYEWVRVEAQVSTNPDQYTYRWFRNGTRIDDCDIDSCRVTPSEHDGAVNVTVVATRSDGYVVRDSTVLRVSDLRLSRHAAGTERGPTVLADEPLTVRLDRNRINHELVDIEWRVRGPSRVTETSNGGATAHLDFEGDGLVRVEADVTLRDQWSGVERTKSVETRAFAVGTHDDSRFSFDNRTAVETYDQRIDFAELQWDLRRTYPRLEQRTTRGLPDRIEVVVADDVESAGCTEGAAACAREPNTIVVDNDTTAYTIRHELTHLAQYEAGGDGFGEYWDFFSEGHAEYEESYRYRFTSPTEKPTKAEMADEMTFEEYSVAHRFVAAIEARHGREAVLDLVSASGDRAFEPAFRDATGESFDAFYERWRPDDLDAGPNAVRTGTDGIRQKPMLFYERGQLTVLNRSAPVYPDRSDRAWRFPDDVTVSWDVDGDGAAEYTGKRVAWQPPEAGAHDVTVRYTRNNRSVTAAQTVRVDGVASLTTNATAVPAEPTEGDPVSVEATVRNGGDAAAERTVRIDFDGETVDSRTVTVAGGETRTVDVDLDETLEPGTYSYRVVTGESVTTGTVTVNPTGAFTAPLAGNDYVPKDLNNDGLYEDVDGDGQATFDDAIALAFADTRGLTGEQAAALDFDGDGDVDFSDAISRAFA